jgi:hypothetical protein
MPTRTEYLESLLRPDGPLRDIRRALTSFGWDSEEELVTLTRQHIRDLILRFMVGELRAEDVEEWADAIEGRDDIGLEAGHEDFLLQTIFSLANPAISEQLTYESAEHLLSQLSSRSA